MEHFPVFLKLRGKPCLIVGGGDVAARKAKLLLRAGAAITVVAPALGADIRVLTGDLCLVEARFSPEMCVGQKLVIAATNDQRVNQRVANAAENAGIFCNVVDDLAPSTFIVPAIVDRSPLIVAIGTSGTAPVLARRLKTQIESWLPSRIGELAAQAGVWRDRVKRRFPKLRDRLRFWERFFAGTVSSHLLAGRHRDAERAFMKSLLQPAAIPKEATGEAFIVGAGPGDPALITLRGQKLLSEADVVLYDALVSVEILDYARKDATIRYVGKRPGEPDRQPHINELLIKLVREGHRVCRLKGGDPLVFGRGGEEAAALAAVDLPYQLVPGISAALGCAASAGIPLTHRGVSSSVTLATGIVDTSSEPDWRLLARSGQTLALYMGIRSLASITDRLIEHGMSKNTPAALVENGTTLHERVIQADLGSISRTSVRYRVRSPAILYVGDSVGLRAQLGHNEGVSTPRPIIGSAHAGNYRPASAATINT